MKRLIIIILLLMVQKSFANNIAVVGSTIDNIQQLLKHYSIPYDMLHFKDLEQKEKLTNYKIIFFPSGMEPTIESNLVVQSQRLTIQSVSIKKSFYNHDKKKIINNIKKFIHDGGRAYFSGYSYTYLQKAYDTFTFHDTFPPMGMEGPMRVTHGTDLSLFCREKKASIVIANSGWIAIKSVANAEILTQGSYETPRGNHAGPLAFILQPEDGYVIYTSYHEQARNDIRRFMIYRLIGLNQVHAITRQVKKWNGKITGKISDAIHQGENYRSYNVQLLKGENNIYFLSANNNFQIDVLDSKRRLIESRDAMTKDQVITIKTNKDELCQITIYPDDSSRFSLYTLIATHGAAPIPYYPVILVILSILSGSFVLYILYRLVTGNRVFTYHK